MIKKIGEKYNSIPKSARASVWFLFANIFQKAVMVIFTPLFTRIMTTEEFSKYAVFQSWETILTVFATLNISNYATAKALVEYNDDQESFITSSQFLTILLSFFTFGIFISIKSSIGELQSFPLWVFVLMFIDIISMAMFSFWSQQERFNQRYKLLTGASILIGISSPLIAFLLIITSKTTGLYKGWARIWGVVIANGMIAIAILIISLKRSKKIVSKKYWKYDMAYCIPLIPHFLAMAFLQKIGQLFVDHYCGAVMSGIYALANSLAMLMMVVNDAFTKTLVPWTYQKMAEEKYDDVNKPVLLCLAVIAIADIAMALAAPELVAIFADKSYADAMYAVPPLVGVCFFGFLYNTFSNIEYYYKETKLVSMASMVAGGIIILANFILVPQFGYIAAAYSALISYVVYSIMHYLFMQKTLKKHLQGREIYNNFWILKLSIIFVLIIVCIPLLYKFNYIRYGLILVVLAVIFVKRKFIIEKLMGIFKKEE